MTDWLHDTNILSELRRPKPEPKVLAFVAKQALERLFVSIVTFADIRFGAELLGDPHRRAELKSWLTHKLRPMFEQRALAISENVMFEQADCIRISVPISTPNAFSIRRSMSPDRSA